MSKFKFVKPTVYGAMMEAHTTALKSLALVDGAASLVWECKNQLVSSTPDNHEWYVLALENLWLWLINKKQTPEDQYDVAEQVVAYMIQMIGAYKRNGDI